VKFLIVRLGALGDIVHAIPVAVALRRAYPAAQIDWVVSAKHREILDLVPVLSHRIVIHDRSGAAAGLSMPTALGELRKTGYDAAFDLQGLLKSAVIARLSGATRVIGFSRRYARESWASLLYTDVYDPGGEGLFALSETRHVVRINLGVLEYVGIPEARVEFALEATGSDRVRAAIADAGKRFVLLNTGAAWPNKRWPPSRFAAVARALYDRHQMRSIVLWGPRERPLADEVVSKAGGTAQAAPATTIADVVVLSRAATVMISGDTGPTHIASAVGTPLVGIYGPTRPERNGPLGRDDQSVSRATVCRCHHLRECRLDRMCLLDIDVPEVLAAVERRLSCLESAGG
jgi:heptosyltransferase-1